MQNCQLKITTTVDGQSNTILRAGQMELSKTATLSYEEEGARVQIVLFEKGALLERFGEYALRLPLRVGETCAGTLSFGDSAGEILVKTLEIERIFGDADLEIRLHYELLFGEETQDMCLRIRAKEKRV